MFLINSRFPLFSATTISNQHRKGVAPTVAPLLPKLRGHFAEFLNHSSPVRLSMLYLTTCVGLGYGLTTSSLEAFLDSLGSPPSPPLWGCITPDPYAYRICLVGGLHAYTTNTNLVAWLPTCVTPSLDYYQ